MREILYRGKRKDNGEWAEGNGIQQGIGHVAYERWVDICDDKVRYEVIPETVGEYTGLKDKNGTKIFEGDIIKNEYGYIGEVVFKACQYYIEWQSGNFSIDLYVWGDSVEVIGNIHDNNKE